MTGEEREDLSRGSTNINIQKDDMFDRNLEDLEVMKKAYELQVIEKDIA